MTASVTRSLVLRSFVDHELRNDKTTRLFTNRLIQDADHGLILSMGLEKTWSGPISGAVRCRVQINDMEELHIHGVSHLTKHSKMSTHKTFASPWHFLSVFYSDWTSRGGNRLTQ